MLQSKYEIYTRQNTLLYNRPKEVFMSANNSTNESFGDTPPPPNYL